MRRCDDVRARPRHQLAPARRGRGTRPCRRSARSRARRGRSSPRRRPSVHGARSRPRPRRRRSWTCRSPSRRRPRPRAAARVQATSRLDHARSSASRTSSMATSRAAASSSRRRRVGAHIVACGEEHLHRRVGEHDGPDVATLDHATAVVAHPVPLTLDEHAPDRGVRRHRGHRGGDFGATDLVGDVAPVEADRSGLDLDVRPLGDCGGRGTVVRRRRPLRSPRASPPGTSRPVSRVSSPSAPATPRAAVDLPDPAGPSIAITCCTRSPPHRRPQVRAHARRATRPVSVEVVAELGVRHRDRAPTLDHALAVGRVGGHRGGHRQAVVACAREPRRPRPPAADRRGRRPTTRRRRRARRAAPRRWRSGRSPSPAARPRRRSR